MSIPQYDPMRRVLPSHARQDRIVLQIGRWYVSAAHRLHLFDALANIRVGPHELPLFNRPTGGLAPSKLLISAGGRGRGERIGSPLFQGILHVKRIPAALGPERLMLSLEATLNPTRYVAHQSARALAMQAMSAWDLGEPNLYRRPAPRRSPGEVVLDQEDNVLLGPASERFGRPEAWPIHLRRYWTAFTAEIDGAIRAAAEVGAAVVEEMSPHLNLKVVETYWEFATDDPTGLVAELEPILFQLGGEAAARTFDYPEGFRVAARRHNAKAVRVRLRPGLSLQVYAKTTGRVRFEIMHELTKSASLLRGGHQSADWGMLPLWLERLGQRATDDLNGALEAIQNLSFEPADSAHVYMLVRRLMAVSTSDHMADAVLSLLVNNRGVRVGVRDPMRPAADTLVASGVLEKARERYTLAPRYRRAAGELAVQRRVLRRQRS